MAYDDKLTAALRERGERAEVICNRELDPEILEQRSEFKPLLRLHSWSIGNRFPTAAVADRLRSEFGAAIDTVAGEEPTTVYLYCGSVGHAAVISGLLASRPWLRANVNLFWDAVGPNWKDWGADLLNELAEGYPTLRMTIPTAGLGRELRAATGLDLDLAPHPSTAVSDSEFRLAGSDSEMAETGFAACQEPITGPLRVLFPGSPRPGKGFEHTLATAEAIAGDPALHPVVRHGDLEPAEGVVLPADAEVVLGPLDNAGFLRLFETSHLSVVPYEPAAFGHRTSGLLIDSIYHGVPVVAARRTWLGEIIDEHGCGVSVEPLNHETLTVAIYEIAADYAGFATRARAAARAYFSVNSWGDLARSIADPPPSPATAPNGWWRRVDALSELERAGAARLSEVVDR